MRKDSERSETLKRVHHDRLRPLRVVEVLDNSAVFENSPVEIKESYAVSDRETGELFLVLIFRCLSEKPLEALDIRLLFYDGGRIPLPARKEEFRYSHETATLGQRTLDGQVRREKDCEKNTSIVCGEEFGEGIFLPLPGDYFRRLQIELAGAAYSDGSYETLDLPACGRARRFADMDSDLRASYTHVNIFRQKEETHPIRVLPQAGKNVWLCCCGHKNPAETERCETCKREKGWQLENLSEQKLRKVRRELDSDRTLHVPHDTSAYSQTRYLENKEDLACKEAQIKKVKWDLYVRGETDKDKRWWKMIRQILEILLLVAAIWGVARLIQLGFELGYFGSEELEESAHILWRMIR